MEQHSIESALLNAHTFKSIYDSSPLVVVGIQRLFIAILQDAINPRSEDDLRELWESGRLPLDRILGFGESFADRFDLFSPDRPFLQSGDLPLVAARDDKPKSAAALFPEMPAGTEVTHYLHAVEDDYVFSPAAAAAGLCTIPAFASSGGAGIKPSINGVPPIYVLPGGSSLFESLAASLLIPSFRPGSASHRRDDAWWRRDAVVMRSKEVDEVGYLNSLTFPARRVRLHPVKVDTACSRTGRHTEWGVRTMIFEMGESRPKDAPWWQDPFVAYRLPTAKKSTRPTKGSTAKKKDLPIPIRPQPGKAGWREFGGLFVHQNTEDKRTARPLFLDQMAALDLAGGRASYSFQCVGVLTDGKAKTFEWVEFGFDVPPAVLNDSSAALLVDNALVFASDCGGIIATVFAKHFGGTSRKAERYLTLKTRMVDSFWAALAGDFRHFVLMMGDRQAQPPAFEEWTNTVVNTARTVFARAAESIGDDAANLRLRSEGEQHCAASLYTRMNKEFNHE